MGIVAVLVRPRVAVHGLSLATERPEARREASRNAAGPNSGDGHAAQRLGDGVVFRLTRLGMVSWDA